MAPRLHRRPGMARLRLLAFVVTIGFCGCGKSTLDAPVVDDAATTDTPVTTGAERPAERPPETPACCPIEAPRCDCFQTGGSPTFGRCPNICDAAPINWHMTTDPNGCPMLVQDPPGGSCLPTDSGIRGG